jgi:hypothetical protein
MKEENKQQIHKPKATRDTVSKRIAAAMKTDPWKALALANYGMNGEAVSNRMSNRSESASFRLLNEAGLSEMIQDWLFLGDCQTDFFLKQHNDPEILRWKREQLEKELIIFFSNSLETGDWKFFYKFADKLKREVNYRDAATLKNRLPIHSELIASKLFEKTVNLSKLAKQFHVSARRVWAINRIIGAKVCKPGKPRK